MEAEVRAVPIWLMVWRIIDRAIDLIRSGCVGLVILIFAMHGTKVINDNLNPWDGFHVNSVHVPDFVVGDNPLIDVDRDAHAEVTGRFATGYHKIGEDIPGICPFISPNLDFHVHTGSKAQFKLFDYMGRTCDLSPGQYQIERQYTFNVPRHTPQHQVILTNVFTVLPGPAIEPAVTTSTTPPGD